MPTLVLILVLATCGGSKDAAPGSAAVSDTLRPGAAPTPDTPVTPSAPFPSGGTTPAKALIARGDSIFHGLAGGICYTCHGEKGIGTALAPSLADNKWIHGDGGRPFLIQTIIAGISSPREYPSMMPPYGGTPLTAEQVESVAAYVHSLSHPRHRDSNRSLAVLHRNARSGDGHRPPPLSLRGAAPSVSAG